MNKLLVKLLVTATVGGLLWAGPTLAQTSSSSAQTITQQPVVEIMHDDICIIRWSTTTPGGPGADHYAEAKYGEDPNALNQTATSPNRTNPSKNETMYRVRLTGLKSDTTYFYQVTSTDANGKSDGAVSDINQFTMPPLGQRVVNIGPPQ